MAFGMSGANQDRCLSRLKPQIEMNSSDSPVNNPCALLITNQGIVIDAHDTICSILGRTREDLINQQISDIFEYGADLLLSRLQAMEQDPSAEPFSVSALVRRKDQSNFPATAIVQRLAEIDCFTVSFEDLPNEITETIQTAPPESVDASALESASAPSADTAEANGTIATPIPAENILPPARETEPAPAHTNGSAARFRNVFLTGSTRSDAKSNGAEATNGKHDVTAQLETERQERRRLEARVLSLTDQLQQLHTQLKGSLESENTYQKRICEAEEKVHKADEIRIAAETALDEEKQQRALVEEDFAQFKSAQARSEKERTSWEQDWISNLDATLGALQESDARLAKEMEARRSIEDSLRKLQQEFSTRRSSELDIATSNPAHVEQSELAEAEAAHAN
jgi:hypothetical protein